MLLLLILAAVLAILGFAQAAKTLLWIALGLFILGILVSILR